MTAWTGVIVVAGDLTDRRARAIEDMPFEFIVIQHDGGSSLDNVAGIIALQETVSLFSMHVFLEVSELPPVDCFGGPARFADIGRATRRRHRRRTGIDSTTRDAISKLEQREDRGRRVPTLPTNLDRGTISAHPDYDGEDWGDD